MMDAMPTAPAPSTAAARSYLDQLAGLLPAREARRVRSDVSALILDRVDALREEDPDLDAQSAELRALEAMGPPAVLAERLAERPFTVPWATVRAFKRALWLVAPCHLLLAILMTVAGAKRGLAGGLMGPIPASPWPATALAVLNIVLVDAGALVTLFWMFRRRPSGWMRAVGTPRQTSRREAITSLVMLALLALIANRFIDRIFAVDLAGGGSGTFLSQSLLDLVPYVNVLLGAFALRDLLVLTGRGPRASVLVDAAATWGGAALMIVAATRHELVRIPESPLGAQTAETLGGLMTKVFLLLLLVGALGAVARGLRLLWQLPRLAPEDTAPGQP